MRSWISKNFAAASPLLRRCGIQMFSCVEVMCVVRITALSWCLHHQHPLHPHATRMIRLASGISVHFNRICNSNHLHHRSQTRPPASGHAPTCARQSAHEYPSSLSLCFLSNTSRIRLSLSVSVCVSYWHVDCRMPTVDMPTEKMQ